jgi:polyphosphate kinase
MAANISHPKYYFNRELSWLKFNDRVLEEAEDPSHPLLERLKFISIFSSNLDEFYMIRVAGVKEQIHAGVHDIAADGLEPEEVDRRISVHTHQSVAWQAQILKEDILPKLKRKGVRIRKVQGLRKNQRAYLREYFDGKIFPVLTPLAIDPTHPFPQLNSLGLNLMVELQHPGNGGRTSIAVVPIPSSLPRFVPLPPQNAKYDVVLIEDVIRMFLDRLFPNLKIHNSSVFRITRNADLDLSEAEADDLLKLIERELRKRRLGTVVRLEVAAEMAPHNREYLKEFIGLSERDIYDIPCCLDLTAFISFLKLDLPNLKDIPFSPALKPEIVDRRDIFTAIRKGDILLHHPYDSFHHVVDFIHEAANDPQVLAIKQTLYRTSGDSPIVEALKQAVINGKEVTALIELKARFDEQNNIEWAKELDRVGVNVVYGVLGLKTHCKILMVVRKEENGIRRYLHLSTGNYNEKTARIYTDLALMTCNEEMGQDASGLFNLLTGYSLQKKWNEFLIAPNTLRQEIARQLKACIDAHKPENPSYIKIVINSLVDPEMIRLLYKASMIGIKVDLVVRGICCLRPGVPGVSESITVKSIVGRFLEHTRIFYFKYDGESRIFMGSADLMQRNLDRRVELVFPVKDPAIKKRVRSILQVLLDDNVKSRFLKPNGQYHRPKASKDQLSAQEHFLNLAQERKKELDTTRI